jgi:hypothetical protein
MILKRRDFVISAGLLALASILPKVSEGKTVYLGNKNYCVVGPDSVLKLPSNPKEGHSVNLIIPTKSIEKPSKVEFSSTPILGDTEDLLLDTFGHIRLTYLNASKGWVISPA